MTTLHIGSGIPLILSAKFSVVEPLGQYSVKFSTAHAPGARVGGIERIGVAMGSVARLGGRVTVSTVHGVVAVLAPARSGEHRDIEK